jgi:hypothetical protein
VPSLNLLMCFMKCQFGSPLRSYFSLSSLGIMIMMAMMMMKLQIM